MTAIEGAVFIALLFVAVPIEAAEFSDLFAHVRNQIYQDFNETRTNIDRQIPRLSTLFTSTKTNVQETNNSLMNDINKYSEELTGYIAGLRTNGNLNDSTSECLFQAESEVLQAFNNILTKASTCVMSVRKLIITNFIKAATDIKSTIKVELNNAIETLDACNTAMTIAPTPDPNYNYNYNRYRHQTPPPPPPPPQERPNNKDINCVNTVYNSIFERRENLFYQSRVMLMLLSIENLNTNEAIKDCTKKYTDDVKKNYLFAKLKIDVCSGSLPKELTTKVPVMESTTTTITTAKYKETINFNVDDDDY